MRWKYILAIVIGGILLFIGGGFAGHYKAKQKEQILVDTFSYKIDSINKINQVYLDSITRLSVRDDQQVRIITKWKIQYDTIVPKQELNDLLRGLDQIGKVNPE